MADEPGNKLEQTTIDVDELRAKLVDPQVAASERLRRTISGDTDSLAWWITDSDRGVAAMLRALQEASKSLWADPATGGIPRLEAQLWGLHNDLAGQDGGLTKVVYDHLGNIAKTLHDPHNPPVDALVAALTRLGDLQDTNDPDAPTRVSDEFLDILKRQGIDLGPAPSIGAVLIAIATAFLSKLGLAAGKAAGPAAGAGAATAFGNLLSKGLEIGALVEILKGVDEYAPSVDLQTLLPGLRGVFSNLFQSIASATAQAVHTVPGDDPDAVKQRAGDALAVALQWGLLAHMAAMFLEKFQPLKTLGLGQTLAFLGDMSAFQPLSNAVWSHLISEAVDIPLSRVYQSEYRSRIPPQGEVFGAARKWEFETYEDFDHELALHGIEPRWAQIMYRYMWADPRLMDVIRMADVDADFGQPYQGDISQLTHYHTDPTDPDWWLDLKFKKAGYDATDLPVLKRVVHARMIATYLTRQRTQLRDHYRLGLYTEHEFRDAMTAAHVQPDAIEIDVHTVQLEREQERVKESLSALDRRFLAGALSADDLRLGYAALVHDTDIIDPAVAALTVRRDLQVATREQAEHERAVRSVQSTLVTAYEEQFKRGLISRDALEAQLLAIGLSPELAAATAQLAAVRRIPVPNPNRKSPEQETTEQVRTILADAYVNQWRAGKINEFQLRDQLMAIGLHEQIANAYVLRELARATKAAADATKAAAAAAQRETAAAAKAAALAKQREADRIANDLEARYIKLLAVEYQNDVFDEPSFLARLERAGIASTKARILVQTEATKKGVDPSLVTDPPFVNKARGL